MSLQAFVKNEIKNKLESSSYREEEIDLSIPKMIVTETSL